MRDSGHLRLGAGYAPATPFLRCQAYTARLGGTLAIKGGHLYATQDPSSLIASAETGGWASRVGLLAKPLLPQGSTQEQIDWTASDALQLVGEILHHAPMPLAGRGLARRCAEAIGRHLIFLVHTASDANLGGRHSAALALFRALEDALDCFAAVSLLPGAAEDWAENKLKPSEAAQRWQSHMTEPPTLPTGQPAPDFRKQLRSYFNTVAHCSEPLTRWDLFPEVEESCRQAVLSNPAASRSLQVSLVTNHDGRLLRYNATRIGAYLAAHTLEFAEVAREAYSGFLQETPQLHDQLARAIKRVHEVIRPSFGAVIVNGPPPELEQLLLTHASLPGGQIVVPLADEEGPC